MSATYIIAYLGGMATWGCRDCDWTFNADVCDRIIHKCGVDGVIPWDDHLAAAYAAVQAPADAWLEHERSDPCPDCVCFDRRAEWLAKMAKKLGPCDTFDAVKFRRKFAAAVGWHDMA